MGLFQRLFQALGLARKEASMLIVGLDNSGKTSILESLKPKGLQQMEMAPTIGFSVDTVVREGVKFKVFDMSGAAKYRKLWEKYYHDTDAVIFVIDSTDKLRMAIVEEEMNAMLGHKDLKKCPVLFFANKQDVRDCLSPSEIAETLSLYLIESRPWQIVASSALTGEGLDEGITWLVKALN